MVHPRVAPVLHDFIDSVDTNKMFKPFNLKCKVSKKSSKMLSNQHGPTFLKNAFSTLLNQCHVDLRFDELLLMPFGTVMDLTLHSKI